MVRVSGKVDVRRVFAYDRAFDDGTVEAFSTDGLTEFC